MKALTLWQPWASLVACGVKRIETRSWQTPHRGPLAIHASKRWPTVEEAMLLEHAGWSPAACILALARKRPALPYGAVVATCQLVDVVPMTSWAPLDGRAVTAVLAPREHFNDPMVLLRDAANAAEVELPPPGTPDAVDLTEQIPLGHFAPGRFAWLLTNIEPADEPIPAKGRQGLWEWTP